MTRIVTLVPRSFRLPVFIAAIFLLACEGPRGDQGPAGPAGPGFRRGAEYCNNVTGPVSDSNNMRLTASCNAAADIPVEGFCYAPAGLPTGAQLVQEIPVNWDVTTPAAGWTCVWAWISGTPAPFDGSAEICCATP